MSALPPAIFLMGPTASGKTDLAIALAQALPCDIISVDSALIYRDMDIGTAKPDVHLLAEFPHRLINIRDAAESYSVAEFREDALAAMADITAAGRIPLLVGGTMLYFRALLDGLAEMPAADVQVRAELEQWMQTAGLTALHDELARVDPVSAARIHPNDPQRVMRALEVYRVSGRTMTEHRSQQRAQNAPGAGGLPYTVAQMAIAPEQRSELHSRIARRFGSMLEQGFLEEVEQLRARPELHVGLPSIRAVGYRQVWEYLDGQYDHAEMTERGIAATRQLAKRQFTWLRSWPQPLCWLDSLAENNVQHALKYMQSVTH